MTDRRRGWHTAELTEENVLEICRLNDEEGWATEDLAEEFGVTRQQINRIKSGQRWGKLTGRGRDTRRDDL